MLLLVIYIKPLIYSIISGKIYLLQSIQTTSGAHLAFYSLGTIGSMPRCKADQSPPLPPNLHAMVKNEWSYMSTGPVCFHGMHKGQP